MENMTDIPNATLELLRTLRAENKAEFADIKRDLQALTEESRIANAHIVGLVRHENYTDSRVAELQVRIERLERALAISAKED